MCSAKPLAGADDLSLSQSYFPLTIATPTTATKASPLVTTVNVPPAVLTEVYVLIPKGHAGQTGIQLSYSGQVIVPFRGATADQWVQGDDVSLTLPVSFPVSTNLQVRTFNTGRFSHTHFMRLKVDYNAYTATSSTPVLTVVPVA
jgi:hypothetical protein